MKKNLLIIWLPLVMGLIGVGLGLITGLVMWVFYTSIDLLWVDLPQVLGIREFHPLMIIALTLIGGLLVGLAQRFLGDYPARMEDAMKIFRETGEFDYKHMPQGLSTSFVSLLFGGSLGPEAAIIGVVGGAATWFSRAVKTVLIRRELVELSSPDEPLPVRLKRPASIMGWIGGIGAFALVATRYIFSGGMLGEFTYRFQSVDLLTAVPAGLVGAIGGVIYLISAKSLNESMGQGYFSTHPIWRALLGGVGLGLAALVFPEVLFSGNHELALLLSADHSWAVVLMGLSKILITALLLAAGWKGGQFLPLMFSGAALGLGLSVIFPAVSPITGVVGGMTGLTTVVMGSPLGVILIILLMVQNLKLLGIIASAALIGYGVSRLYAMLQTEVPVETSQSPLAEKI